jgi:predicted helicase
MPNLQPVLAYLNSNNLSERDKGTRFEEAAILFLLHAPAYAATFKRVLKFGEWAALQGRRETDTGVDLVGELEDGTFAAIQAKFYEADRSVSKPDIDSFISASVEACFTRRIIVATTDKRNDNAEETLVRAGVTWIGPGTLDDALDWSDFLPNSKVSPPAAKTVRPHQREAIDAAKAGFQTNDRGQLIMACGTGKTFTSLRLAEELVGPKGKVLFLVPSLSLLSQTLTEWAADATVKPRAYAVCSDSAVGKRKVTEEDKLTENLIDLAYPATTNAAALVRDFKRQPNDDRMTVVYSTYHSIQVVADAQAQHGFPEFDLIVCDEAHRTTGAIFEDKEESAFVKVHDAAFIKAKKRVYMTATPRVYGSAVKSKAQDASVELCSMDDATKFGPRFHTLSFSRAIDLDLLCDYKVMVLTIDEKQISEIIQHDVAKGNLEVRVEDAGKIVGCWKALLKEGVNEGLDGDTSPMKRAVAFCQVIGDDKKPHDNRVTSKRVARDFAKIASAYETEKPDSARPRVLCEVQHVDGSMNAIQKGEKLRWLREEQSTPTCRILSNVRCLTEGVDVPALDAVLFLSPRKSTNEVVQAVGRVMRKSEGKKRGYVVLPIVIPPGADADAVLNKNAAFQTVWQVLNALRSHDDRFEAHINKLEMTGEDTSRLEILSVIDEMLQSNSLPQGKPRSNWEGGDETPSHRIGAALSDVQAQEQPEQREQLVLPLSAEQLKRAIQAKIVERCGNRKHWEQWAGDIAKVAQTHITRISSILSNPSFQAERAAFDAFAAELRDDLNPSLSDSEIVEMLAQHLVTAPVFSALFEDYAFADRNPVSTAMQKVIESLEPHRLDVETGTLEAFYQSIRNRVRGIQNAADRQKIVVELYDKFFSRAFPRLQEKLGIVYTPVEVVDFILHSVEHLLQQEFGTTMADDDVHILDPFTGTGTFLTRLIQSGIIPKERLAQKYGREMHANELVLLAYYIASVNIESAYHDAVEAKDYEPFGGICLTDTFQMYEGEDMISQLLADNSGRRGRQKGLPVRVIVGNPPYSVGQKTGNDDNQNVGYPALDARIAATYATRTDATNKNSLYDSYIRAIRWASDRIGDRGIIGFVTAAGWVGSTSADGLRKCLVEEFDSLYVFHLRGDQQSTSGEESRREGGKVFGQGSRVPVAISFLVKNPAAAEQGRIFFCDIGDYLTREAKLGKIKRLGSVASMAAAGSEAQWTAITPDQHGDWLKQRRDDFTDHIVMGDKKGDGLKLFENYSAGVQTNRDAWAYGSSRSAVAANMERMVVAYNRERGRYTAACEGLPKASWPSVESIVTNDPAQICWSSSLVAQIERNRKGEFCSAKIVPSLYRPFSRQRLYFDPMFNHRVYQMPRIFPTAEADNLAIAVSGKGAQREFSVAITNIIPDAGFTYAGQCFPLYLFDREAEQDEAADAQQSLLDAEPATQTGRRDAITDAGLEHFASAYPGEAITKEDLFYYTYGILHAPSYREQYGNNLGKELPRIPRVKTFADFCAFRDAGRTLAALHLGFDSDAVPMWPATIDTKGETLTDTDYRVKQMRYVKGDKTTVIYNDKITVRGLPMEAQDYMLNGKSGIDWVLHQWCVYQDKDSGITNDCNDFATETMGNPRYPLELLLRAATVSVETLKIMKGLPEVVW